MQAVFALWALAAGCESPIEGLWSSEPSAPSDSPLADPDYRFCHLAGESGPEVLDHWCGFAGDPQVRARCPGLVETCEKQLSNEESPRGCEPDNGSAGPGSVLAPPERPTAQPLTCQPLSTPDGAFQLLRWVGAIGAAAIVLVLVRLIITSFARADRRLPVPPSLAGDPAPEEIPDAPSADLLGAARQALASGRVADAVLLARGAALRRLGEAGRLHLHRSRTDREYQRQLRNDPAAQGELRSIFSAVEGLRWGGRPPDLAIAEQVVRAAERLIQSLAVALLAWLAIGSPEARAVGYEADGEAALAEVLGAYGYDVGWRLVSLDQLDDTTDALVLDTQHGVVPFDDQWDTVQAWVERGGVLVLLGSGFVPGLELGLAVGLPDDAAVTVDPAFAAAGLVPPVWPDGPSLAFEAPCRALVRAEVPEAHAPVCLVDRGAGAIIAVADPRIFRNAAFAHPDNVAFVGDLLYTGQSVEGWDLSSPPRVQLATRMATQSSSDSNTNPLASLAQSGLLLFVAQLLATWGLAMLYSGWPFAPLRDPREVGRVAFAEHVRALGLRWFRQRESGYAYHRLAQLWFARLGRAGLISAARRAGYPAEPARAWASEIERAANAPPPADRGDTERMEELWRVTCHRR